MSFKIQNGAEAIFTQPIYDLQIAKELISWNKEINQECKTQSVLVLGFFPITSYKTALFLHNKLPGVYVPQDWLDALEKAHNNEAAIGLAKSKNFFEKLRCFYQKIHFMSANKPKLIENILC